MTLPKILATVFLSLLLFGLMIWFSLPDVRALRHKNPGRTSLMEERGGPVLQRWVPLSQISPTLRRAVIVSEDAAFYGHEGVDFHEVRESIEKNLEALRWRRGFSTITMQVAKNLYLSSGKTISRKILELIITRRLEQTLSKERILEIYLNIIEWGDGIYGAEAASEHYFHKSAAALTPPEAAFLAAIIPNPLRWGVYPPSPYIAQRQRIILGRIGYVPEPPPTTAPESVPESHPTPPPESQPLTPIPETL